MEASCASVLDHYASVIHAFQFAQSSASPLNGDDEDLLTYPAIGHLLLGHNRPPCSRGVSLHLIPLHSLALPVRSHPRYNANLEAGYNKYEIKAIEQFGKG